MSKEWAGIIIGLGLNLIFITWGVVVKTMPLPLVIGGFVVGSALIILGVIGLIKSCKIKRIIKATKEMHSIADNISHFASDRKRNDPTKTPPSHHPSWNSWSEERRKEEYHRYSQCIIDYTSDLRSDYQKRFAGKVICLVGQAAQLGYHDNELERYYQDPVNTHSIEIIASHLISLAHRIEGDYE